MKDYNVIGLMSGTSLDGVDIVYCTFYFEENDWHYKINYSKTYEYDPEILSIINKIIDNPVLFSIHFHNALGSFYGIVINRFMQEFDIAIDDIYCVASHGQTILHDPEKKITIQAGAGYQIAASSEITTVSDFRVLDVALGGQGAPLVPIGDLHLFKDHKVCINLGGICNLSVKTEDKSIIAFDIAPCNTILNHFAALTGNKFDDNGELAKAGEVNLDLLHQLNNYPYYQNKGPKSLDAKIVVNDFLVFIKGRELQIKDILRTLTEHIAIQINKSLELNKITSTDKILLSGGGCFNGFLIERIKTINDLNFVVPENIIVNYKEALIFAFMGLLRMKNEINVLSSVTGASVNSCSGTVNRINK